MAMLCFVLDLRTLSSSTVRALKRSLLQLANFCAVSDSTGYISRSRTLGDRIGLCYIIRDQHSCSDELKVAYEPCEKFNLRKFHHAVDCLPTNAMLPKINDSEALFSSDTMLASFLSGKVLYKWGGYEKGITKKAILISSRVPEYLDSVKKDILMEAAEKSVSVEFLLSEPKSSLLGDLSETINTFVKQISDLDNCSFRTFLPDPQVLCGLVKGWLQDLKNDIEPLQARFTFKSNIFETVNCISCTLSASATPLVDGFDPCQACRCHGVPLDEVLDNKIQQFSSCPVTGHDLEPHNLVEKCLKVGEHTVLLLPSFGNYEKLQVVSQPVDLNVIERTSVGSLSEAVLLGTSFIVSPFCDPYDIEKSELNTQVFQGLCSALHSLDQGLVCSSKCNIETKRETLLQCYYILKPLEKGLMLLRRLAGSEEALPFPNSSQLTNSSATCEIGKSVLASLLKMEERDYNPSLHERGFHRKLNVLVKESVRHGSTKPLPRNINIEPDAFPDDLYYCSEPTLTPNSVFIEDEIPKRDVTITQDQVSNSVTEKREQLVVCEGPKASFPRYATKRDMYEVIQWAQNFLRMIEERKLKILRYKEKKAKILERLMVPRKSKRKSPSVESTATVNTDMCVPPKAPPIPFPPINGSEQGTPPSPPMEPDFQRNKKRKR